MFSNPKLFWNFVNSKRISKETPSEFHYDGNSTTSGIEIANMFADYFSKVYSNKQCPNFNNNNLYPPNRNITNYYITISDVYLHLNSLDINKGPGPDGIPPAFLKHCSFILARPLHLIFNLSLSLGILPEFWKVSYLTPIYKTGDRDLVINYRPISILNTIPKVFENILSKYLTAELSSLIIINQFGFMAGRSTELNLLTYVDFLSSALERGSQVHAIYTDFSKAFDRVNHVVLLSKLSGMGVGGPMLDWIESYLTGRSQIVKFNNFKSQNIPVPSGVPQGSHLGPLLFILFVNDLWSCFEHSQFLLFADDLKLYMEVSSSDDCLRLQSDIDRLASWCSANGMDLNASKCYSILFHRSRAAVEYPYYINNNILLNVPEIRDLGILVNSRLSFTTHIERSISKSLKLLGFVKRIAGDFTNVRAIKQLYNSLIRPHLEYGSCVWNPHYNVHKRNIESVQHKFLKFIAYKLNMPNLSYSQLESHIQISTLEERRNTRDLKMLYNVLHCKYSSPMLLGRIGLHVPSRETRSRNTFFIPNNRTNYGQNSFISRSCKLANEYPSIDFFQREYTFLKQLSAI